MSSPPHQNARGFPGLAAALVVLFTFCAGLALRLMEWPAWRTATDAWLGNEPLLPTHDAYAWAAGALGTGRMAGWPLSEMIAGLAELTAQTPATVAFWLPLWLGPLSGVVVALFCAAWRYPGAGLPAGVMAASGLGYLLRTRLGYADTDLFALTLVTALAAAWCLAWRQVEGPRWGCVGAAALAFSALMWLYPSGYPVALAVLAAGALGVVLRWGSRGPLWAALALVLVAGHFGWAGLLIALGGVVYCHLKPAWTRSDVSLAALGLVIAAALLFQDRLWGLALQPLLEYAGLAANSGAGGWSLPTVATSIRESATIDLGGVVLRLGIHWIVLLPALAGFAWALWRWPVLLAFAPLLGLALASYGLGHRFAMYGVPAVGLGLGLGLALLLERLRAKAWLCWSLQGGMAALLVTILALFALHFSPHPVLGPVQARAFMALGEQAPANARIWTWWDLGYAAQYYARQPSFADGASTSRQRIFALGQVYGAPSPLQASQVMQLAALARQRALEVDAPPFALWHERDAEAAQQALDRLNTTPRNWPDELPPEYLAVSWYTLRHGEWISRYARWNLVAGDTGHGRSLSLSPPVELDRERGLLRTPHGTIRLRSLDILERRGRHHQAWPRPDGHHAVINNVEGQGLILDDALYYTMVVQMLIADPKRFDDHFELVVDAFPIVRIYRVKSDS